VLTLLPLVLVLFLAIRRVPAFVAIMLGALFGGVVAVILQPELVIAFAGDPSLGPVPASIKAVWQAMATGFYAETGYPMIDDLVSRGGMISMLGTVWLVLAAMGFGAIMDYTGSLRKLLTPVVKLARTAGQLMVATGLTSIFLNIFAGDQYMAVVLPGTLFREEFEKRNIAPQMLSRQLVDTGTVTSPLVPWNTCGAYMAATLGVATVAYFPYCFFNLINPIVSFALDLLGIQIIKIADDKAQEAYAPEPEEVSQYGVSGFSVSKEAGGLAEQ
jgi:NhaC family Na+:H+ antiporter